MKGHKFLKVTGILMIIAAVFSIIAGVLVGGLGVLAAGLGAESGLTFPYWAALFLTQVRKDVRQQIEQEAAPKTAVTCPYCGATTTPDVNGCCEYCGGAVRG